MDDDDAENNCRKDKSNKRGKATTNRIFFHPGRRCELCSSCSREAAILKAIFNTWWRLWWLWLWWWCFRIRKRVAMRDIQTILVFGGTGSTYITVSSSSTITYLVASQGSAGILQICNIARHNVVIIYVPIYHAFYYLMHI